MDLQDHQIAAVELLDAEIAAEQESDLVIHLRTLPARRTVADKLEDLDHTMEDLMTDEDVNRDYDESEA